MNTIIDRLNQDDIDLQILSRYADILKSGGTVAFPTETVYGIGACCLDENAVKKIFSVKKRPANNPLIAHISDISMLGIVAESVPESIYPLFDAFWPGALTVVLPKKSTVPDIVTAGGKTVAVRCPSHPIANALIKLSGVPIVAPSANLSGRPSPTEFMHVYSDLKGKVDGIIDGGSCDIGIESTVVLPTGKNSLTILRPGAITPDMLKSCGFDVTVDPNVLTPVEDGKPVASPGMLHKHYAPKAKMILVRGNDCAVKRYISSKILASDKKVGVLCFDGESADFDCYAIEYGLPENPLTLSHNLFSALRRFDQTDIEVIYARVIAPEGVGLGIYNRMLRAAAFNVVNVGDEFTSVVGLTGHSGSGKTTAAQYFISRGYTHIDCDKIVHERVYKDPCLLIELSDTFGDCVIDGDEVNRRVLAKIIFSDKEKYNLLMNTVKPYIISTIVDVVTSTVGNVLVDAPTLFEFGLEKICTATVGVISNNAAERIIKRDKITSAQASDRLKNQFAPDYYKTKCDYVIENNGTLLQFEEAVKTTIDQIEKGVLCNTSNN